MAGHHDADPLLVLLAEQLQLVHPAHALLQTAVIHFRGRLVRRVDGVLVAKLNSPLALLL